MQTRDNIIEIRGYISKYIPVLLKIEHEKYDPEKIECELHLLTDEKNLLDSFRNNLSGDEFGNLRFTSADEDNCEIVLKGISGWSLGDKKAKLNIYGYEYGFSKIPIQNPKHIYLNVELTPSGILRKWGSRELHYDGSIKVKRGYPEDIEWACPIGKGKAFVRHTYEDHNVFDNKATLQIERPTLSFNIDISNKLSTHSIKESIENEIRDLCLILSLCYRKSVNWYEINFTLISDDKDKNYIQPFIRRKVYHKKYPDFEDELINHGALIDGGLYALVCGFRNSPQIDSLRRSISFLSSSESDNTIEVKYFLCIISLESFCDGFIETSSKGIKIPPNKWEKIEKALRQSLDDFTKNADYLSLIEKIKKKLPELKRVTTLDKIINCCRSLNVDTDDLWNRETFEEGLSKSLEMRNHLFHRAFCDEPYELYSNLVRLQILTERLLLKSLSWPDEKIWRWYDQKLRRVNRAT